MQIVSGQPGKNPYYSTLSSYHIVLPIDAANHVTDYSSAQTTFRFWIGNSEQNVDASNLIITPSSGGDITYTVANESNGKGVIITVTNVDDSVVNQQIVIIKYVLDGVSYEQDYSINKSRLAGSLDNVMESSYVDGSFVSPSTAIQLVRVVKVPADMLLSSGDILEFTVQAKSLDASIDGNLLTSYFTVDINGFPLISVPYYSTFSSIVKIRLDFNNLLFTATTDLSYSKESPTVYTGTHLANSRFNYTNIDWSIDNFINVRCFLDSAYINPNSKALFNVFQLAYKHNLNTH